MRPSEYTAQSPKCVWIWCWNGSMLLKTRRFDLQVCWFSEVQHPEFPLSTFLFLAILKLYSYFNFQTIVIFVLLNLCILLYITFYHKLTLALNWIGEIEEKKRKPNLATLCCDDVPYFPCLVDPDYSFISKVCSLGLFCGRENWRLDISVSQHGACVCM